jgi:hypothetical protein
MKVPPGGPELFHADGQTDGHYKDNSRFSQFHEDAKNTHSKNNDLKW